MKVSSSSLSMWALQRLEFLCGKSGWFSSDRRAELVLILWMWKPLLISLLPHYYIMSEAMEHINFVNMDKLIWPLKV